MDQRLEFDLNNEVHRWRDGLAQSPAFCAENLDELESHLRDSVTRLQATGLSDEESFLIATKRLGASRALGAEFGKVNGRVILFDRLLWILVAFQIWRVILSVSAMATAVASRLLSAANDLMPGFDLKGISLESVQASAGIIGWVVVLAAAAMFARRFFLRAKADPPSSFEKLPQRPGLLSAALFLSMLLGSMGGSWSLRHWFFPIFDPRFVTPGYRDAVVGVLHNIPGFLIISLFTFFVARKRLYLIKA